MSQLARESKHLTPSMFADEVRKLGRSVPIIAVHIKPRFYDRVVAEIGRLASLFVKVGTVETPYEF
jgi:hypothetical protein